MTILTKKMLRTLSQIRGQALAVILVMLCGTACYVCLASAHRNLLATRDTYYAQKRLADFEIMVERVPTATLFKIEELPGVRQVRGRVVQDVKLDIPGVDDIRVGRLISMPMRNHGILNDIVLQSGRYFEPGVHHEVILSDQFAERNNLQIGGSLEMTLDGKKYTLRIIGRGQSPEYVYMIRNIQEFVPSPARFGILWVSEDFAEMAMDMQGACNNVIGSVDDPEDLDRILDQAEDLLDSYGVFAKIKKEDQISNRFISDEIRGLSVMAKVVPSIFLGIAALVILILLNRMVRNERTQIGLLKAYGYSQWTIALHYLQFALILSVIGCIGGFFVGQWFAGVMIRIYVQFYQFPLLVSRVYPDILVRAMGIAMIFALIGALSAAWRASRIQPAESMRPEAPQKGRRIWLEGVDQIWGRLSFTSKFIVRNVARNRFRSALNAFGTMQATGLLIIGFYGIDAVNFIMKFQYEDTQREDVKVSFITERGIEALYESAGFEDVWRAEPLLQYPFEIRAGWRKKDVLIQGLPRHAALQKVMDKRVREMDIGEQGLTLIEYLAEELGVTVGDTVTIKPLMGRLTQTHKVRVAQISKQYFGTAAYMNIEALSRLLDEPLIMNAALLRVEPGRRGELGRRLRDIPGISAVEVKEDSLASLKETIATNLYISSAMVICFAAIIALSVIYNVTAVSLGERQRELASLRVLGFHKAEVGRIMYYENFLTGTLGIMLGLPFGAAVCWGLTHAYDTDLYRFPFHLEQRTYLVAAVLTFVFVILANLSVRHKIHRLDMVEVLKERE